MKSLLLSTLVFALLLGACSDNAQINEPGATPDAPHAVAANLASLDLSLEQAALIDEMHFMDEDLSLLLDPVRLNAFDGILDRRFDRKAGIDIAAIIYYQLIVKANPDLGERILLQLRELIAESNQRRQRILASDLSPERKRAALQEEHERLIAAMNRLIGERAVANVRILQARLDQERKDRRDAWQTVRIDRLVEQMKSVLDLTAEEAAAVKRILLLQYEEITKLRAQYKDSPEGFREALIALQKRIDAMLTQQLGAKWERWKALQQRRITPGDRVPDVGVQLQKLTQLLGLTERQQAAVKEILLLQQREMLALMQKYQDSPAKLAEALRQLQQRVNMKIASLLNDRQLVIWKKHLSGGVTSDRG